MRTQPEAGLAPPGEDAAWSALQTLSGHTAPEIVAGPAHRYAELLVRLYGMFAGMGHRVGRDESERSVTPA